MSIKKVQAALAARDISVLAKRYQKVCASFSLRIGEVARMLGLQHHEILIFDLYLEKPNSRNIHQSCHSYVL